MVTIAVVVAAFMLLAGCEDAGPLSISGNAKKIQATLDRKTASAILQKYLVANEDQGGLIGYFYHSVGDAWVWMAHGTPTQATVTDGIVRFEASSDTFKSFKDKGKNTRLPYDATPSWFVSSKFEIDLTIVRGVVFWDPVHTYGNLPRGRVVDLLWSDPEDHSDGHQPPGAISGALTIHIREGNADELIAAIRYFAPTAHLTAAR